MGKKQKRTSKTTKAKKNTLQRLNTPDPSGKAEARRDYIIRLIQEYGYWNINVSATAEKFGVSRQQIYLDIEQIKAHVDIIDAEDTKFECGRILKKVSRIVMQKLNQDKLAENDLRGYCDLALRSVEQHGKFLEDFGVLESRDKQQVTSVTWEDFYLAYKAKTKRSDDDSAKSGGEE